MALKIQYDEREVTESKFEELTIPSASPFELRLEEVPDEDNGVEVRRVGPTTKNGTGSGDCQSGGSYTGMADRSYKIQIDTGGEIGGEATFKWSNDGGQTWQGTLIPIEDEDPIQIELGITVSFTGGAGTDFVVGDYWTFDAEFWTEVGFVPTQSKEFMVNYRNGDVIFHSADAGKTVQISYEGRGSLVDAEDVNQIIEVLNSGEVAIREQDTSDFSVCDCVGVDENGDFILANATDDTKPAIGFIKTVDDEEGEITIFGPLGGFSGLTPGSVYYLDVSDGQITSTPPSESGNIKQKVGRAISSTTLLVRISDEIEVVE